MSDEVILKIYADYTDYYIDMTIGVQSFEQAFTSEDYDAILWYANQMKDALEKTGASVRIQNSEDKTT
mgnify:CR=1 FL=1